MGVTVDQVFLAFTTRLHPPPDAGGVPVAGPSATVDRIVDVVVALAYAIEHHRVIIGETWAYYLLGSTVEVVYLVPGAEVRAAWVWPTAAGMAQDLYA